MRHIIQKQVIDLTVSPALDAIAVQERAAHLFVDEVLPALEKLFDALASEDYSTEVDTLCINLGRISLAQLYQPSFIDELIAIISRQVREQVYPAMHNPLANNQWPGGALSVFRQWLWYMEKGFLPWHADHPDRQWYASVLESGATEMESVRALRQLIRRNPKAVERIVSQHELTFLQHLAELLTAKNQKELPSALQAVAILLLAIRKTEQLEPSGLNETSIAKSLWQSVFALLAAEFAEKTKTTEDIIRQLMLKELQPLRARHRNLDNKVRQQKSARQIISHPMVQTIWQELERLATEKDTNNRAAEPDGPSSSGPLNIGEETGDRNGTPAGEIAANPFVGTEKLPAAIIRGESFADQEILEEGIYAVNAGLVLLHPFLSPFFRALGIWNGAVFVSAEARQQALFLLHFLATGSEVAEEYELVMPKFLVQFPLSDPVGRNGGLSAAHKQEAVDLLADLVAQWSILKNTSVDGLRESFLQRRGKLVKRQDTYHLLVEESSIDMLLDYLPWNLGMPMLPWMKDRLLVEWRFRK